MNEATVYSTEPTPRLTLYYKLQFSWDNGAH